MYLIRIVGTGYQQEEPREGVVGWTWKTGFTSFTKGKTKQKKGGKKKNQNQTDKTSFNIGRGTEPYHSLPI